MASDACNSGFTKHEICQETENLKNQENIPMNETSQSNDHLSVKRFPLVSIENTKGISEDSNVENINSDIFEEVKNSTFDERILNTFTKPQDVTEITIDAMGSVNSDTKEKLAAEPIKPHVIGNELQNILCPKLSPTSVCELNNKKHEENDGNNDMFFLDMEKPTETFTAEAKFMLNQNSLEQNESQHDVIEANNFGIQKAPFNLSIENNDLIDFSNNDSLDEINNKNIGLNIQREEPSVTAEALHNVNISNQDIFKHTDRTFEFLDIETDCNFMNRTVEKNNFQEAQDVAAELILEITQKTLDAVDNETDCFNLQEAPFATSKFVDDTIESNLLVDQDDVKDNNCTFDLSSITKENQQQFQNVASELNSEMIQNIFDDTDDKTNHLNNQDNCTFYFLKPSKEIQRVSPKHIFNVHSDVQTKVQNVTTESNCEPSQNFSNLSNTHALIELSENKQEPELTIQEENQPITVKSIIEKRRSILASLPTYSPVRSELANLFQNLAINNISGDEVFLSCNNSFEDGKIEETNITSLKTAEDTEPMDTSRNITSSKVENIEEVVSTIKDVIIDSQSECDKLMNTTRDVADSSPSEDIASTDVAGFSPPEDITSTDVADSSPPEDLTSTVNSTSNRNPRRTSYGVPLISMKVESTPSPIKRFDHELYTNMLKASPSTFEQNIKDYEKYLELKKEINELKMINANTILEIKTKEAQLIEFFPEKVRSALKQKVTSTENLLNNDDEEKDNQIKQLQQVIEEKDEKIRRLMCFENEVLHLNNCLANMDSLLGVVTKKLQESGSI